MNYNARFTSRKQWLAAISQMPNTEAPASGSTATITKHNDGTEVNVILNELVDTFKGETEWVFKYTFTELNREKPDYAANAAAIQAKREAEKAQELSDPWLHVRVDESLLNEAPF